MREYVVKTGACSTLALNSGAPRVKAASCAPETAGALRRQPRHRCGARPRAVARARTARSHHCRAAPTLARRVCARRAAAGGRPARCMACAWHVCMARAWHVHGMCMCGACAGHVSGMCTAWAMCMHGACMAWAVVRARPGLCNGAMHARRRGGGRPARRAAA